MIHAFGIVGMVPWDQEDEAIDQTREATANDGGGGGVDWSFRKISLRPLHPWVIYLAFSVQGIKYLKFWRQHATLFGLFLDDDL